MPKIKILLVDDEPDFVKLMSMRISGWGYGLVTASNGKEAVDSFLTERPDIVILDYLLPDMDGVSVLKTIRKRDRGIPVIMFTAYPDVKVMKEAERLGVCAFIPKVSAYSETIASLKSAVEMTERMIKKGEGKKVNKT